MVRPIKTAAVLLGIGLAMFLLLVPWLQPTPAEAEDLPPDQPRKVVFELFTPPVDSSGGG